MSSSRMEKLRRSMHERCMTNGFHRDFLNALRGRYGLPLLVELPHAS